MKIVIAGGSGFLGNCLINHYSSPTDQLCVLTRSKPADKGNVPSFNGMQRLLVNGLKYWRIVMY